MVVYINNLSHWKTVAGGVSEFKVSLSYVASLRQARAT